MTVASPRGRASDLVLPLAFFCPCATQRRPCGASREHPRHSFDVVLCEDVRVLNTKTTTTMTGNITIAASNSNNRSSSSSSSSNNNNNKRLLWL